MAVHGVCATDEICCLFQRNTDVCQGNRHWRHCPVTKGQWLDALQIASLSHMPDDHQQKHQKEHVLEKNGMAKVLSQHSTLEKTAPTPCGYEEHAQPEGEQLPAVCRRVKRTGQEHAETAAQQFSSSS